MGYRSDVAYVIRFATTEQRDAYMELVKHRNDEHMVDALEDCESRYEEPIITYETTAIKWYVSDYVKGHSALMTWAVEIYEDAGWRCVQLGEDGQEEITEGGDDPYDLDEYVRTQHVLHIDFPEVISTTTAE
jgi:hypothetical protein